MTALTLMLLKITLTGMLTAFTSGALISLRENTLQKTLTGLMYSLIILVMFYGGIMACIVGMYALIWNL